MKAEEVNKDEVIEETVNNTKEASIQDQIDAKQAEFDALFKKRTEENYTLEIGDAENLKLLKKYIKDKNIEWTGTEAVGYVNAVNKIDEVLNSDEDLIKEDGTLELKAYLMEAISYFINKYKGNGFYEAKNFVRVAYPVQKTILQMRQDDDKLKALREEIGQLAILGGESEDVEPLSEELK